MRKDAASKKTTSNFSASAMRRMMPLVLSMNSFSASSRRWFMSSTRALPRRSIRVVTVIRRRTRGRSNTCGT